MSTPEKADIDLDDPQTNALTTPELDGDDVQEVEDSNVGDAEPPADKDS